MKIKNNPLIDDVDIPDTLFVEGSTEFDATILQTLLNKLTINVQQMGSCQNLSFAAYAFQHINPYFYFLIDRDYRLQQEVENSWQSFSDPEKHNLLIWRRKHIENYFIIPEYICKSPMKKDSCTDASIKQQILSNVQRRLFLDVVNTTLMRLKDELKVEFIDYFLLQSGCNDKDSGLAKIRECLDTHKTKYNDHQICSDSSCIENIYEATIEEFTGGGEKLQYGKGKWPFLINGKEIMYTIFNNCFKDKDDKEQPFTDHKERYKYICESLLRLPMEDQPQDFKTLYSLIQMQVNH